MVGITKYVCYGMVLVSVYIGIQSTPINRMKQCDQVLTLNCATDYTPTGNETLCCSDGNVYDNFCFFARAKCQDPNLTTLNPGHCMTPTVPTANVTQSPGHTGGNATSSPSTGNTDNLIHTVFCENKDALPCNNTPPEQFCGTDFKLYKNDCEFAKAKCDDASLQTQHLDMCHTANRQKRSLRLV